MTFGPTGITPKSVAEHRQDMRDAVAASSVLGPEYSTGGDSEIGVLIDIVAEIAGEIGQTTQAIVDSQDPDTAQGLALDSLGAIRGDIERNDVTASTGVLTVSGTIGTLIPSGSQARVSGGPIVETLSDVTLTAGTDTVNAQCTEAGAIEINALAVDTIVTSIVGWTGVINTDAFDTGEDVESDPQYRLRQRRLLLTGGKCTDQDIARAIDDIDTVDVAYVISNRTAITDAYGIPPYSFMPVVWPDSADADEIAEAIWEHQPAGIGSYGAENAYVEDEFGYSQKMNWSWADEQAIHVVLVITTDDDYPADGDDLAKAAILAEGELLTIADDVLVGRLSAAVQERNDQGVFEIPGILTLEVRIKVGSTPGPGDTSNISIDRDEIATFSLSNITVI